MPDAMMLSVGGTLSVGGSGESGFRFGAQVDQSRARARRHHRLRSAGELLGGA
jgi:hypothetical protein